MYARIAAEFFHAWCRAKWPGDEKPVGKASSGAYMASTMANGEMIDAFDHRGGGSHKYIPADRLTEELGESIGAGVFGYWLMGDGSYLLRTCDGRLAYWSGKEDEKARWAE